MSSPAEYVEDPSPDDEYGRWDDSADPAAVDSVDLVVEAEAMMSVFAAQRFERIEFMRRDALRDAARHGYQLTEVIERSVRLELAAALGMTEATAGHLIAQADALVNRYAAALASLGGARMTQRHAVHLAQELDAVEPEFHGTCWRRRSRSPSPSRSDISSQAQDPDRVRPIDHDHRAA